MNINYFVKSKINNADYDAFIQYLIKSGSIALQQNQKDPSEIFIKLDTGGVWGRTHVWLGISNGNKKVNYKLGMSNFSFALHLIAYLTIAYLMQLEETSYSLALFNAVKVYMVIVGLLVILPLIEMRFWYRRHFGQFYLNNNRN